MRYKILLFILILLSLNNSKVKAQCVNGTETNPNAPMPINSGFKTNTFDWRQNPIPIEGKFVTKSSVINPFWNNINYLQAFQGGLESDSKPSDGWELIKQDFGYAHANNSWNGQTLFNATSANKSGRAYIMLYNKYSGTLRIMTLMDTRSGQYQMLVVVSLKKKDKDVSNYSDLTFNALFNRYNKQETALDVATKVSTVAALSQISSDNEFFYADFNLSYDPCICYFQSALQVDFYLNQFSTMQLTGKSLDKSIDVAQNNTSSEPNYFISLGITDTTAQPYNQHYYSFKILQNQIKKKELGAIFSNWTDTLQEIAKTAKLQNPKNSVFSRLTVPQVTKIGKLSGFFDLLSMYMGSEGRTSTSSVISSGVSVTGDIGVIPINGSEFLMGTPGSKDAELLPEYPTSLPPSQGIKPMYPMYNELLGKFAIVRTPEILFSKQLEGLDSKGYQIGSLTAKLNDVFPTFSYAFNPIVDETKTRVFVGLELRNKPGQVLLEKDTISQFLPIENARHLFLTQNFLIGRGNLTEENFNVIFQIHYQFKPDANGEIKVGTDMIKIKPKITFLNRSLKLDPRFQIFSNTPTDLNIGSSVFNQGQTIYSFGNIAITGNLTNNSSAPVVIIAQGEININQGINFKGNIEFRSGQGLPPSFPNDPPVPPMTSGEIQNFCTSNLYKAKEATSNNQKDDVASKNFNIQNLDFNVAPNPFTHLLLIDLSVDTEANITLELSNILGQIVKIVNLGTKNKGQYQETIDTYDLACGVYLLTLRTQNGMKTKKIVKQ